MLGLGSPCHVQIPDAFKFLYFQKTKALKHEMLKTWSERASSRKCCKIIVKIVLQQQ